LEKKENIIYTAKPVLRRPYMVCGIDGWVNGGEASTGSVKYLIRQFTAKKFAEMPTSPYHIYQVPGADNLRPVTRTEDGLIMECHFPRNQFFYARNPASDHDLILFLGSEPNLNWEDYAASIAGVAKEFQVARLYISGGVLDETPHTCEPRVSCSCTSAEVREEMRKYNVTFSNRSGPTTFNTIVLYFCQTNGIEAVSLSTRATYYPEFNILIPYNPKSIKAILVRLNHLMHLNLNFDWLNDGIKDFEGKLEFMRKQSPRFNAYVEELEKNYVEMPYQEPLDISPDEAIKLAEDILKKNKG